MVVNPDQVGIHVIVVVLFDAVSICLCNTCECNSNYCDKILLVHDVGTMLAGEAVPLSWCLVFPLCLLLLDSCWGLDKNLHSYQKRLEEARNGDLRQS